MKVDSHKSFRITRPQPFLDNSSHLQTSIRAEAICGWWNGLGVSVPIFLTGVFH